METANQGMHSPKAQPLRQCAPWEMPDLGEALDSLERMSHRPSVENLIIILRKCRKGKNPAHALRLHAYMHVLGLEAHRFLGSYLLCILVEVGNICHAQQVFDRLVDRNEYSWTYLIKGYIECGELQHALILYHKMQEHSVHPSGYTFGALLKACALLKDTERGREIHAEIARKGLLESDPFIGSSMVDMYAKCDSLVEAREVFDKLPVHGAVSWTALIAGYGDHELGQEALNCLDQMRLEGITPDAVTFVCGLKACSSIGAINKGREIHAEIARKGLLESNPFVVSTLVDMYAKCCSLVEAQEVFDKPAVRDAVSWTALIAGYAEHELGQEALKCYEHMQLEGISPNVVTFVCSLKACGCIGAINKGREIHAKIARKGLLESDPVVGNTMVDMYAKCGSIAEAQEVLDKLPVRGAVSWNALIAGYAEHELCQEALNCFEQMQLEGLSPDAVTFVCILKACGRIRDINKGREIHAEIARKGLLESDPVIGSILVDTYAKSGSIAEAQEVFDELPVRGAVSWNALIAGYAEHKLSKEALNCFEQMQLEGISADEITFVCSLKACGRIGAINKGREIHTEIARKGLLENDHLVGNALVDMHAKCGLLAEAREVFDKLPVRGAISWNALITGYAEHELGQEALNCLEQMQLEGISPDVVTFVCSLKACGRTAAIRKGREIHAEIVRKGLFESDPFVGNTLVDMYAKCGSLAKAQEVFEKLPDRDAVSWTALITGYAQLGESENTFHMFDRMKAEDIKPDGVTFLSVLTVCSHTGLVDKGQTYFEAMSKDYGITPTIEHHVCMVDLLGRAGQLDKAVSMIKKMPCIPNLELWHTMLGACWKWGNVELGRWAFGHAMQLDKKDAAAYILMSNIYVGAHMPDDAKQVEVTRLNERAWKKLGQSWWTDTGGIMHSFLEGHTGDSLSNYIYAKLEELSLKIKEEGYISELHWLSQDISSDLNEDRLCGHSEKLAIVCALINTPKGAPIHVVRNLRVCKDCHLATALISKVEQRTILVRDVNRSHVFTNGKCACGDYW